MKMNFQDIEIFYNDSFSEYLAVDRKGKVVFKARNKRKFWQGLTKKVGFAVIYTDYKARKISNKRILEAVLAHRPSSFSLRKRASQRRGFSEM